MAIAPDADAGERKKRYTFSWTGGNGQPGSLTITQGDHCYILAVGQHDSTGVEKVTFNSFQMEKGTVGAMRYKSQEGKHLTLLPGAVGPRFLLPQIEQWGLHNPQQQQHPAPAGDRRESADRPQQDAAATGGAQTQDRDGGSSQGQEAEEAPRKRLRTDHQKAQRKAKDEQAQSACLDIQHTAVWQGKVVGTFTIGATEFDCFKLDRRARCKAFGMKRYAALKKLPSTAANPAGRCLRAASLLQGTNAQIKAAVLGEVMPQDCFLVEFS